MKTIGWTAIVVVVGVASLAAGGWLGARYERQQLQLAKTFGAIAAEDALAAGNVDEAISILHLVKSAEPREGDTDALLGKAYMAKGAPCLAQRFLESGMDYMEKNNLTSLARYGPTKALLSRAALDCAAHEEAWSKQPNKYNYFRDYDSAIGRYSQSDPIGLRGGLNTYAYARNSPHDTIEPLRVFRRLSSLSETPPSPAGPPQVTRPTPEVG